MGACQRSLGTHKHNQRPMLENLKNKAELSQIRIQEYLWKKK